MASIEENNMNANFFDEEIFGVKIDINLLHEVVRWQLAKRRSGTRKTKSISEIKATTRKPHRQKGTGRARQGSLCSPQFRGGAVIFGPVVRSHAFALNKKMRKLALKMALSQKLRQKELAVVEGGLSEAIPAGKKKVLLVGSSKLAVGHYDHFIDILPSAAINVYSIINHDYVLFTPDAINELKEKLL